MAWVWERASECTYMVSEECVVSLCKGRRIDEEKGGMLKRELPVTDWLAAEIA